VKIVASGRADSMLSTNLLGLNTADTLVAPSGRSAAGRTLQLSVEVVLTDKEDKTLWRSGLIEVQSLWPISVGDPAVSEAARERVLMDLATQIAEQVADLLPLHP
jgi:hypothetical protein